MLRKLRFWQNERVDLPDALAIHDLADEAMRGRTAALWANATDGPLVLGGFGAIVNPGDDTQIVVTGGTAIVAESVADAADHGQVLDATGTTRTVDLSGLALGTCSLWCRFRYLDGEQANRAAWRPDLSPQREEVQLDYTRSVSDWQAVAVAGTSAPAGIGWFKVYEVTWDGGLVAGNLHDLRNLFFEGQGEGGAAPATSHAIPDFDRGATRAVVGVHRLRQWVMGVAKRLEELGGRRWYTPPVWGENVRSASAAVTVRVSGGDATTAHVTLSGSQTDVLLRLVELFNTTPTGTSGDPRAEIAFLPSTGSARSTINVSTAAASMVLASTGYPKRIGGPANIVRLAGATNALIRTDGYSGIWRDMRFTLGAGAGALLRSTSDDDDLTFENCTFDCAAATGVAEMIKVEGAGRLTFINCTFVGHTDATLLQTTGFAWVRIVGGRFVGGAIQIESGTAETGPPNQITVVGTTFEDCEGVPIQGATGAGRVVLVGVICSGAGGANQVYFEAQRVLPVADGDAVAITATHHLMTRRLYIGDGIVKFGATNNAGLTVDGADWSATSPGTTGRPSLKLGTLQAVGRLLGFQSAATAARWYYTPPTGAADLVAGDDPNGTRGRVSLLDAASKVAPSNTDAHALRLVLGKAPNDALAAFSRDLLPKAWGCVRVASGGVSYARGVRGDGVAVSFAQTLVGDDDIHSYVVSGLGLPDADYCVTATLSLDGETRPPAHDSTWTVPGSIVGFESADLTVAITGKTSGGFTLWPTMNGLLPNALNGDYSISWVVHAPVATGHTAGFDG